MNPLSWFNASQGHVNFVYSRTEALVARYPTPFPNGNGRISLTNHNRPTTSVLFKVTTLYLTFFVQKEREFRRKLDYDHVIFIHSCFRITLIFSSILQCHTPISSYTFSLQDLALFMHLNLNVMCTFHPIPKDHNTSNFSLFSHASSIILVL